MKYYLGWELKKTQNLICRYFESLKKDSEDCDITYTYRRVIGFIYRNRDKDIYQKDIEKEFSLRRSTASVLIAKMEKSGLIIRESQDTDKRLKKLLLTDKAVKRLDKFCNDIEFFESMLANDITESEAEAFITTLTKIRSNVCGLIENSNNDKS